MYLCIGSDGGGGSSQAVTGVTAVTDTIDQDLREVLDQVPIANYRQKLEDAIGGMPKEEAIKASYMVKNGKLYTVLRMLSQYQTPEPQEGKEEGTDSLW